MHDADINAVTIEKLKKAKSLFEWSSLADEERAGIASRRLLLIVSPKDAHRNLSVLVG